MIRRGNRRIAIVVVLLLSSLLAIYLFGGSTLYDRIASPDGRGVVELYTPARWQTWRTRDFEMPVVARYIEPDGTVIASNTPIELSGNGRLYWDADGVSIGSTAAYDRRTRTWSVTY